MEVNSLEIYSFIRKAFSELVYFEDLAKNPVNQLIEDAKTDQQAIFLLSPTDLLTKYVEIENFKTEEQKKVLANIKIVLVTTQIYLYSKSPKGQEKSLDSLDSFLKLYPEFLEQDEKEKTLLLTFYNYLKMTMDLISPKSNKILYIRILERLEGSSNSYITGTGQTPAVDRRVLMYQRESGIIPKTFKKHPSDSSVDGPKKKSKKETPDTPSHFESVDALFSDNSSKYANSSPNFQVQRFILGSQPNGNSIIPQQPSSQRMMTRQYSLTCAEKESLLNESYKGSFTEEIKNSIASIRDQH